MVSQTDLSNTVFSTTRKSEAEKYKNDANKDYRKRKVRVRAYIYTTSPKLAKKTYFVYIKSLK